MQLTDAPAWDPRPLLSEERADLLTLLSSLTDADWVAPTEAGRWRVKEVFLHLLDDDLGWLSRGRDGDDSGLLPESGDYRDFVHSLDAKNERWVIAAGGMSRCLVAELLEWSGERVDQFYRSLDLTGTSSVIWAASVGVPRWFDLARDFTERWVHQQHVRDAVDRCGRHERHLEAVLRTFVWAFPHQYDVNAPDGTIVQLDFGTGGRWTLTRSGKGWVLDEGSATAPSALLQMPEAVAWRQLTGLHVHPDRYVIDGTEELLQPLLEVRGIIV